jgi:hypothetical protein
MAATMMVVPKLSPDDEAAEATEAVGAGTGGTRALAIEMSICGTLPPCTPAGGGVITLVEGRPAVWHALVR